MKQKIIAVTIYAAMAGAAAWAAGTPKIQFDQMVYDLGATAPVKAVTGKFIFENAGDGVLQVQKPSTTCGCTVGNISPDTYKPGEKGELVFTVDLSKARGPFQQYINVPSNDPQNPTTRLTVKADVKPIFEVSPPHVALGDLKQGEIKQTVVQVQRLDGKNLAITKVEAGQEFIMVNTKVQPVDSSQGRAVQITVDAQARHKPQRFAEALRVYAADSAEPALVIPIHGRILGDVVVQPEALTWIVQNPAQWPGSNPALAIRRVSVSATRADPPLELRNVTSDLEGLGVQLVKRQAGNTYEIVATLNKPPENATRTTISFETNIPTQPKVEVPVMISVFAGQPQWSSAPAPVKSGQP